MRNEMAIGPGELHGGVTLGTRPPGLSKAEASDSARQRTSPPLTAGEGCKQGAVCARSLLGLGPNLDNSKFACNGFSPTFQNPFSEIAFLISSPLGSEPTRGKRYWLALHFININTITI